MAHYIGRNREYLSSGATQISKNLKRGIRRPTYYLSATAKECSPGMTARFVWKQRESLRSIEKRARQTLDPLERLRYVRDRMDSRELPERFRMWPIRRIATMAAAALGAALLIWRIHLGD
jgi:hypothetical protein